MSDTATTQAAAPHAPAGDFTITEGDPTPYGATVFHDGVNFSVWSRDAQAASLVLFHPGQEHPFAEIPFPEEFRVGKAFTMKIAGLDHENVEYGFRMEGPYEPRAGQYFKPENILLDPYARQITGRGVWRSREGTPKVYPHRARIVTHNFDWEGDQPLQTPIEDLVIYEMHVRSFTQHPSSGVEHPGTFRGMIEKIPYLKELGVNCVELMPIFDFDEFEHARKIPGSEDMLVNYWGYSTVGFFAPKAGYAAAGAQGGEINELKELVKALHRNGIEVILDVVYNHTAEGNEKGPTISFRGIDNRTYYMLTPENYYYNFSGTGNTLNCNHPAVIQFILDSLRYWVTEYHVDGFRFDLASILTRAEDGKPLADPPLLKMIAHDPVLGTSKLIAEPWDAGGLYHVGSFPAYGRWAEWNGKYRDALRKFLKSDASVAGEVVQRLQGSPDLYPGRGPIATVNFITAHDGFTLRDLVSYNEKHNEANLENNRDGFNDNNSWNCGYEGETEDPAINGLRWRQMKNAMAMLMVSQGVPMFLMGDEVARTQRGNNNTYCQDNDLNWLDWTLLEQNHDMLRYTQTLIAFRKAHPVLRSGYFLQGKDYRKLGMPDIKWFRTEWLRSKKPAGPEKKLTMAFMLGGAYAKGGLAPDDHLFVAINMHWEDQYFGLPRLHGGNKWHVAVNTAMVSPEDIHEPGTEPVLDDQKHLMLTSRSVVVLVGR